MLLILFVVVVVAFHAFPIVDWMIKALHKFAMGAKAVADAFEKMIKDYRYMRDNHGKELVQ